MVSVNMRSLARGRLHALFRRLSSSSVGRRVLFTGFAAMNRWGSAESLSGEGSTLAQTEELRRQLPVIFEQFQIRSLLDIPCGDAHWMRMINGRLHAYIGADIVTSLVNELKKHARSNECFLTLDVVSDPLPEVDAVLSRDVLVHLSLDQALQAVENIRNSGSRFLLATTFPGRSNRDIATGGWRPLDLAAEPFDLGPPLLIVNEACTESGGTFSDKSLGVWQLGSPPPQGQEEVDP